ncbi:ubiquitin carboxyl-terminal hydrolase 3-like [Corticium candelabrum]|uniref:ubiquitin carboxyl-terminal hydrolase 3-like n=1 Tax=Corticium candelabrum TaxID=121492 RepID=UPI002E25EBE4|nr:ubiquitin carboxyl-terminal hydrolase 3-like [Corticium candelabrum]
MECPHVDDAVKLDVDKLKLASISQWTCEECRARKNPWICLTCGRIHCGRYINAHALSHFDKEPAHCVCLDQSTAVFCYRCDEFVINDTPLKHVERLRQEIADKQERNRRRRLAVKSDEEPSRKKSARLDGKPTDAVVKCHRVGLRNLGNTCFMNSVLQSLSNIKEFTLYFMRLPSFDSCREKSRGSHGYFTRQKGPDENMESSLVEEVRKCVCALCNEGAAPHSPDTLFAVVWQIVPRFRGYQQQDAHEFLRYLLDKLHSELLEYAKRNNSSRQTIVSGIFGGQLRSEVNCLTCESLSIKHDPILDLSLDIPQQFVNMRGKGRPQCRIQDCLASFVQKEELDETEFYQCTRCQSRQRSTKKLWMTSLPPVLCLHLKRFRFTNMFRTKIDIHVQFPIMGLDMLPFLYATEETQKAACQNYYDLAAVIVHHGSGVSSGHYTAYACSQIAGTWFHFNDSTVTEVSTEQVASCKAYILFYVRRTNSGNLSDTIDDFVDVET